MAGEPAEVANAGEALRRSVDQAESAAANRGWWDAEAVAYYAEHGHFLGDAELTWGPEGWTEGELQLLGDVRGLDVLEVGAGGAQGARWCARHGARAVATDLSEQMLRRARTIDAGSPREPHPTAYLQCDATSLPFADATFDLAFSAYGAVPFVADSAGLMREVARVLRPGGRWVFSVTHPVRWAFLDEPGQAGLTAQHSYFDRRAYVEQAADGAASYAEHHRTLGDRVRELVAAGLVLDDLVEPEWRAGAEHEWGGWSRLRGELLPGTAIFLTRRG